MTEDEEKKTFGTSSMAGDLSYQLGFSDLGTNSFLDETDK